MESPVKATRRELCERGDASRRWIRLVRAGAIKANFSAEQHHIDIVGRGPELRIYDVGHSHRRARGKCVDAAPPVPEVRRKLGKKVGSAVDLDQRICGERA